MVCCVACALRPVLKPQLPACRKEKLWPHIREFADRGIAHTKHMQQALGEAGAGQHACPCSATAQILFYCSSPSNGLVSTWHSTMFGFSASHRECYCSEHQPGKGLWEALCAEQDSTCISTQAYCTLMRARVRWRNQARRASCTRCTGTMRTQARWPRS